MATVSAAAPSASRSTSVSSVSSVVPLPLPLMKLSSAADRPAWRRLFCTAVTAPAMAGGCPSRVQPSRGRSSPPRPSAETRARTFAPRAAARSARSTTNITAPSPKSRPWRLRSYGCMGGSVAAGSAAASAPNWAWPCSAPALSSSPPPQITASARSQSSRSMAVDSAS